MRKLHCALLGLLSACAPPFSTERPPAPGTFGERVVTLVCKRLAFEADPSDVRGDTCRETCDDGVAPPEGAPATIVAITADRAKLVAAIDGAVPPDQTAALQAYLTSDAVLALYDDGTMTAATANLAAMLDEMGADPDAMAALARLGGHRAYRTPETAIGPNGVLLNAQGLDPVLDSVLPAIVPGGAAETQWNALVAAISATMLDASPSDDPERAAVLARDLLLADRADIAETSTLLVRRDERGVAQVAVVDGALPAPFVDTDGDGLPDVDAFGRFVDAAGAPLAVPPPFPQNDAYVYVDLGHTVLGALSHDTPKLLDPATSTAVDLARGAAMLLGPRAAVTRTFDDGQQLAFTGWDRTQSPLLDMAYAYLQILRDPNTPNVLALTQQLFAPAHVSTTARLAQDAITTARLGAAHPEAQIVPTAPLWDDLQPVLRKMAANPKLMRDVLAALQTPEVAQLGDRFREFMTFDDSFDIDDSTQAVTGSLAHTPDRTQPDTGGNRSLFERLVMLIADSQVKQCNKTNAVVRDPITHLPLHTYAACDLFEVPNLAVFYLQSIAYAKDANGNVVCESDAGAFAATQTKPTAEQCGSIGSGWRPQPKASFNYQWGSVVQLLINTQGGDKFVETQAGITGFRTHPTPEALNRVLFKPTTPATVSDTADPIVDRDGDLMKTKHAGTLPVWEKNDFYNQVRPLVQAFADNNEEQTFIDLMDVLHKHWASAASTTTQHTNPAGKNYTFGSNAVSWEPLIADVLTGDLYPALTQSAAELNAITVNGKSFSAVMTASLAFLVTPQAQLANRLGVTTSHTSDGRAVAQLSPWQLLADAYNARDAQLASAPNAALWTDSTKELVDILFRADQGADGTFSFRSDHTVAVTLAITQFLADRIASHDAAGDRVQWLSTDLPADLESKLEHPVFAGGIDLIEQLTAIGPPRAALDALLVEIFDPVAHPDDFATMRVATADLLQLATDAQDLDALGHVVGGILAPGKSYLPTQLAFLNKLHAADTEHTLKGITGRLFQPYDAAGDPGVCTVGAMSDGIGDIDRPMPGVDPAWSAADYAAAFHGTAAFFTEEKHGLPRFIAIVAGRSL